MEFIIVKNDVTNETYVYACAETIKARIAIDYLNTMTPYSWYIVHEQIELHFV